MPLEHNLTTTLIAKRVVDLSRELTPEEDRRLLRVNPVPLAEYGSVYGNWPATKADEHCPMHRIDMASHIGTHLEVPFHWGRVGMDLAELPLSYTILPACRIDLRGVAKHRDPITAETLKQHATEPIQPGDAAVIQTGVGEIAEREGPYLTLDAAQWLVDRGIRMLAVESTWTVDDTELGDTLGDWPVHRLLLTQDIPILENLTNLQSLTAMRFTLVVLPPKIRNCDSICVRAIALES